MSAPIEILKEIKDILGKVYQERIVSVVLYGSEARGEATSDSDIDILALLKEPVNYAQDLESNIDALYPLAQKLGRRISAKPISAQEYRTVDCPLYRHTKEEGLAA
ncbi:MAG: nucleotidyltransferase domain-containing protein [Deltaproteobacteria bacterium]|nr:nucleotidyltransferase domain-containing protein [Deltaproteobacteria bacterium]